MLWCTLGSPAAGQEHDHAHMQMAASSGWHFMEDGRLFVEWDHQGSERGGNQFVAPNWWMGMGERKTSHGDLAFTAMLSLEPATVGREGYLALFQAGEVFDGRPIIDRQHPHDLFMQLSAAWRFALSTQTTLTLAGGPVGEPALGPVAFMHRESAGDNPAAPLGHHTFDSTHISYGVVTAAIARRQWIVEGSVFNGREPDDRRWDFDFGRLDSFSGRVWFRPGPNWELQASSGRLRQPEALEPGDIVRSTASVSWTRSSGQQLSAVTLGIGRNDTAHGTYHAFLAEAAHRYSRQSVYTRFETLQMDPGPPLATSTIPGLSGSDRPGVFAFTAGTVHHVVRAFGIEGGIGADLTIYRTPEGLSSAYGAHPLSAHVFFELRSSRPAMTGMHMGRLMS
jgi:hypothetical protein